MGVRFSFNFRKALAALLFLACQGDRVRPFDKYKAVKLLFLAEKSHLARYGRPIFGDYYRALPWGPVPQSILDILHQVEDDSIRDDNGSRAAKALGVGTIKGHGYPCFFPREGFDPTVLSKSELRVLQEVVDRYGRMAFDELYELTHRIPAYERAWSGRGDAQAALMRIEDFFDDEAVPGALEEVLEDYELRRQLSGGR